MPTDTLVLGAGVIGLTTALRLQEAGLAPRIVTKALPPTTTSAVAAAMWYPYKAYPEAKVLPWSRRTLDVCYDLRDEPAAGVSITTMIDVFDRPMHEPWWKAAVRTFRRARPDELPEGYVDGFVAEVPLIETPIHLRYLLERFEAGGGIVDVRPEGVADLAEVARPGRLIVNCTGLGARALVGDEALYPIRGQIVRVANPGLDRCIADDLGPRAISYVIPRRHDVVLGGTAQEHDWNEHPDDATTDQILANAAALEPRIAGADALEVRVGLRPGRPAVRLEREPGPNGSTVVHNYGHGGSGFTLAWGCAEEVVRLSTEV